MFDGGIKKLTAVTHHPVPAWLNDGSNGPFGFSLMAAALRIDLGSLVDGASVYVGEMGKVGIVTQAMSQAPGNLSVYATRGGVRFRLSAMGVNKFGVGEPTDWEITCGLDGGELALVPDNWRTVDKSLANEKLFRNLRDAIVEAVAAPPRYHTVPSASDALALLDTVESSNELDVFTIDVPRAVRISAAAAVVLEAVADATLSAAARARLSVDGSWPLWVPDGAGVRIEARSQAALRIAAILLSNASGTDDEAVANEIVGALKELCPSPTDDPGAVPSPPAVMLSSRSRFVPHQVTGTSASSAGTAVVSSLWPCLSRVGVVDFGRGRKAKTHYIPARLGLNGVGQYSYGPSIRTDAIGPMIGRGRGMSYWGLSGYDREGDGAPIDIWISSLSVQSRCAWTPGSDQLLTWLSYADDAFSPPIGTGGAQITLVDRAG